MSENKVKFGLKNVHYALVTETVATDGSGAITSTYGSLKALAGAVSLSMSLWLCKSIHGGAGQGRKQLGRTGGSFTEVWLPSNY